MKNINKQTAGRRADAAGRMFEKILDAACGHYREKGTAVIEKTPEPMRPLKPYGDRGRGQYIACFEKRAQPDYKGVLRNGKAVIFEAEHTDKDRIQESVITETQRQNLDDFEKMGTGCFVMVSIGFRGFCRVPWHIFRDMKSRYGRKYMNAGGLEQFRLKQDGGILMILEGVELDED